MTIYTVIASTQRTEWVSKSFTCAQSANDFLNKCKQVAQWAHSKTELIDNSPDPMLTKPNIIRILTGDRVHYTLHINELVTDAFMELTLQPHKPRPFKDFL